MDTSRRDFLRSSAAAALAATVPWPRVPWQGYEPWLEVSGAALANNVRTIARIAGGRPVIAVVKNNAYGVAIAAAVPVLAAQSDVAALAVVKTSEASAVLDAGVRKPVLLMALAETRELEALVRRGVQLAVYDEGALTQLQELSRRIGRAVPVHFYIDTGINRVGMAYHRALPWMERIAASGAASVQGTMMTFTESESFDQEQLARFHELTGRAKERGVPLGRVHASSSYALFLRPNAHFDRVRTGLVLYGAYPAEVRTAMKNGDHPEWNGLTPAFRLRARVVRVEQLRAGDSVSYGRNYIATRPTWVATLPVGHADGYPRNAVKGCEVLIGDRLYRVIGAVSASHSIVEVGDEQTVRLGDTATLVGPDRPEIQPNTVAERAGISVYDVLMHLSARLPVRT